MVASANNKTYRRAAVCAIWKHTAVNRIDSFHFKLSKIPLATHIHWMIAQIFFTEIGRDFIIGNDHGVVVSGNGFYIHHVVKVTVGNKNIVALECIQINTTSEWIWGDEWVKNDFCTIDFY